MSNDVGDSESSVACEIYSDGRDEDAEALIKDQTAQSPIWVATRAFADNPQNKAATTPALTVVITVRAVLPCLRKAPAMMALKGSEMAYNEEGADLEAARAAFLSCVRKNVRGRNDSIGNDVSVVPGAAEGGKVRMWGVMKQAGLMLIPAVHGKVEVSIVELGFGMCSIG